MPTTCTATTYWVLMTKLLPAEVLSPLCAGADADPDGDGGDGVVPLVARQAGHPPLHRAAGRRNGADRCILPLSGESHGLAWSTAPS